MQGRRKFLYVFLIVSTSFVPVNGATAATAAVLIDKILYSSNEAPDRGIYYMDLDGSGKTEIVHLARWEELAAGFSISPCGSKIAYGTYFPDGSKVGIYLVNVDGSDKTELVTGVIPRYGPVFTPDGRELFFTTGVPEEGKVFSVTLEGTALKEITDEVPGMEYPSFSSDGKYAVFEYGSSNAARIGRWDIESNQVKYISEKDVLAYAPRVSPNGELIAYGVWENGKLHLCVMDSDGKNPHRLTRDKNVLGPQYSFSPDNKNIVFAAEGEDGLEAIYKIGVDGTNETRLTYNQSRDVNPVYSPDGRFIAFLSMAFNTREIFIMNSDGNGVRRLTTEGFNGLLVFSPVLIGNSVLDSYGNFHALGQ
jgi:TolB protein